MYQSFCCGGGQGGDRDPGTKGVGMYGRHEREGWGAGFSIKQEKISQLGMIICYIKKCKRIGVNKKGAKTKTSQKESIGSQTFRILYSNLLLFNVSNSLSWLTSCSEIKLFFNGFNRGLLSKNALTVSETSP